MVYLLVSTYFKIFGNNISWTFSVALTEKVSSICQISSSKFLKFIISTPVCNIFYMNIISPPPFW